MRSSTWCVPLTLLHGGKNILGGALDARTEELMRLGHVDRGADLVSCAKAARKGALRHLTGVR